MNNINFDLQREYSEDETAYCREQFATSCENEAGKLRPERLVYPYDYEDADNRAEASVYHKSRKRNNECARAIDAAISESCYKPNHYNLEIAAMKVIGEYGFSRVNAVLARHIHRHEHDGRYSSANKTWAARFTMADKAFDSAYIGAHAVLVNDFTTYVRELFDRLDAGRLILPGVEEHSEHPPVQGYAIIRSIMLDGSNGYVIAHNPNAVDKYVCWKLTINDGERRYDWGVYGSEKAAENAYIARLMAALTNREGGI